MQTYTQTHTFFLLFLEQPKGWSTNPCTTENLRPVYNLTVGPLYLRFHIPGFKQLQPVLFSSSIY